MWKIFVRDKPAPDGNAMRSMHIACWLNKPTDSHSSYSLISFPRHHFNITFCVHSPICYLWSYDSIYFHFHPSDTSADALWQGGARCVLWIVSCDMSADDAVTTRRGLCQWPYAVLKRITCLTAVEVCLTQLRCVNDRPRLVSHL